METNVYCLYIEFTFEHKPAWNESNVDIHVFIKRGQFSSSINFNEFLSVIVLEHIVDLAVGNLKEP